MKGIMYRALVMAFTLCLLLSGIGQAQETAEGGKLYTLTVDNIRISRNGEEDEPIGFKGVITFGEDVKSERGLMGVSLSGGAQGDTPIIDGKLTLEDGQVQLSLNGVDDVYAISMDDMEALFKDMASSAFGGEQADILGQMTDLFSSAVELSKFDLDAMDEEAKAKIQEIVQNALNARKVAQDETVEILGQSYTLDRYEGSYTKDDMIDLYREIGEVNEAFAKFAGIFEKLYDGTNPSVPAVNVVENFEYWTNEAQDVLLMNATITETLSQNGEELQMEIPMVIQTVTDGDDVCVQMDVDMDFGQISADVPMKCSFNMYAEEHGAQSGMARCNVDYTIMDEYTMGGYFDYEFEAQDSGAINGVLSLGGAFNMPNAEGSADISMDVTFDTAPLPEGALMDVEGRDIQNIIEMTQDDLAELQTQLQTQAIVSMGAAMQTEGVASLISEIMTWSTQQIFMAAYEEPVQMDA